MERTRIAKVENVTLARRGEQVVGTLHLTPHHLIFCHVPPESDGAQTSRAGIRPKELWITYPIISFCILRSSPAALRHPSSIRLRCRDFTFVCFYFESEVRAREVYDSIKQWTCRLGRIDKLYAFTYQPPPPELEFNGWDLYDASREYARQGIGGEGSAWRISQINADYTFSPTYPALLVVPSSISDNTLNYAGRYRSRARVPVLTYFHPVNSCTITRSSQPLPGIRGHRSIQDEKLLAAIFSTSQSRRSPITATPPHLNHESSASSLGDRSVGQPEPDLINAEEVEDKMMKSFKENSEKKPHIYGAQQQNLIVDARPTVNALAMQAVGLGSENMDNYKFATKAYLGIDNIHVMRDSLAKVVDALKESDVTPLSPSREQLARSGWLKHISEILDSVDLIVRHVSLQHSHVLLHCSDGWDRTGQLSALSQICLDPYFRTLEGFMILVEKDWLSFGHMFRRRSGHLNSEKWFQIENERSSNDPSRSFGDSGSAGKALENAFLSAKGFFNRDNVSRDSLIESESDAQIHDSDNVGSRKTNAAQARSAAENEMTKVKDTSPVFHQFLDATYQLLYQYPTRFEFNERFLRRLLYHLYSCQFGTFLYNNEKERVERNARERTRSVWDYFLARREQFINPIYNPSINDNERGSERLIFPRASEVRWWSESFGRTDAEMNGIRTSGPALAAGRENLPSPRSPVVTGVETADHAIGSGVPEKITSRLSAAKLTPVTEVAANFAISKSEDAGQDWDKMSEMEVEMQ